MFYEKVAKWNLSQNESLTKKKKEKKGFVNFYKSFFSFKKTTLVEHFTKIQNSFFFFWEWKYKIVGQPILIYAWKKEHRR